MPISIEKLQGITREEHGIIRTAPRSFDIASGYYKAFGPVVKLVLDGSRGTNIEQLLLTPLKARELAAALVTVANSTEEKYNKLHADNKQAL